MPKDIEASIDFEMLQESAKFIGAAFAVFQSSFLAGFKAEIQQLEDIKANEQATDGTQKQCEQCWCHECALFEDCIVPIEGYNIESKPCPCDGCYSTGKPYMPKEKSPCKNFKPKE